MLAGGHSWNRKAWVNPTPHSLVSRSWDPTQLLTAHISPCSRGCNHTDVAEAWRWLHELTHVKHLTQLLAHLININFWFLFFVSWGLSGRFLWSWLIWGKCGLLIQKPECVNIKITRTYKLLMIKSLRTVFISQSMKDLSFS